MRVPIALAAAAMLGWSSGVNAQSQDHTAFNGLALGQTKADIRQYLGATLTQGGPELSLVMQLWPAGTDIYHVSTQEQGQCAVAGFAGGGDAAPLEWLLLSKCWFNAQDLTPQQFAEAIATNYSTEDGLQATVCELTLVQEWCWEGLTTNGEKISIYQGNGLMMVHAGTPGGPRFD